MSEMRSFNDIAHCGVAEGQIALLEQHYPQLATRIKGAFTTGCQTSDRDFFAKLEDLARGNPIAQNAVGEYRRKKNR